MRWVLTLCIVVFTAAPAYADALGFDDHERVHPYTTDKKNGYGGSCCDMTHCRTTTAWQVQQDLWRAYFDGVVVDVTDPKKILDGKSPFTPYSVICGETAHNKLFVYCLWPAGEGT